jgi:ribosomal-protein-alanine N-acetyltransferase
MLHKGTVLLEGEAIILCRFELNDLRPVYENCWRHYDVWKWTNYKPMNTPDEVKTNANMFTDNWLGAYAHDNRYSWAIVEKQSAQVIGRMFGMHPDDEKRETELAYELGPDWWNKGYMTDAVKTVLCFFFEKVGLDRVYCFHADKNPASGRVVQKAKMKQTEVIPGGCACNGGTFDKVNYKMTRDDYFSM